MEKQVKNQGNLPGLCPPSLIMGLGRSGRAVGDYFQKNGVSFAVSDDRPKGEFAEVLQNWPLGQFVEKNSLDSFKEIILSPGIPLTHPLLKKAIEEKIPILSEIEFASRLTKTPLIAITGTNGKSTTVGLVAHFLKESGYQALACGNFGTPLMEAVSADTAWDALVVEVSSFQGETIHTFHPRVGAFLNLTDDHLDRYGDMDLYLAAKERIFQNQTEKDFLVVNAEETALFPFAKRSKAKLWPFSSAKSLPTGAFLKNGKLILRLETEEVIDLSKNPLIGLHHLENIAAASLIARAFGLTTSQIEAALPSFKGLPHRLEKVRELSGVKFYDDSKATNVGALAMSLASFDEKVVLIAGGRDKESDFKPLAPLIKGKVEAVFLIGEAAEKIGKAWEKTTEIIFANHMTQAVPLAFERAKKSQSPVVLAPACASFDQFKDYKDRGRAFVSAVGDLC